MSFCNDCDTAKFAAVQAASAAAHILCDGAPRVRIMPGQNHKYIRKQVPLFAMGGDLVLVRRHNNATTIVAACAAVLVELALRWLQMKVTLQLVCLLVAGEATAGRSIFVLWAVRLICQAESTGQPENPAS